MAPRKGLRTYSRVRNPSVSGMEAVDILFATNLTVKKIAEKNSSKKKIKYEVKDLPVKIKSVLKEESSLHVNFNDTFDQMVKHPMRKTEISSRTEDRSRKNPPRVIISKLSNFKDVSAYSNKTMGDSNWTAFFNQATPTGVGITKSLEIEYIGASNCRKSTNLGSRSSPVVLRSHIRSISKSNNETCEEDKAKRANSKNSQQISIDIQCSKMLRNDVKLPQNNFVRAKHLLHSTPVKTSERRHLLAETQTTMSPIQLDASLDNNELRKSIDESLSEIKKWSSTVPQCLDIGDGNMSDCKLSTQLTSGKSPYASFQDQVLHSQAKSFSLAQFENFYESYQNKFNLSNESHTNTRKFVTNRRDKFSLVPRKHNVLRYSRNVFHKELMVVLDNNLFNYSKSKLTTKKSVGCLFANVVNSKQLVVKLTRLSLEKLKLRFSQTRSLINPCFKRKFKACRKFSSNWTSSGISQLILLDANNQRMSCSGTKETASLINVTSDTNTSGSSKGFNSSSISEPSRFQEKNDKSAMETQVIRRSNRLKSNQNLPAMNWMKSNITQKNLSKTSSLENIALITTRKTRLEKSALYNKHRLECAQLKNSNNIQWTNDDIASNSQCSNNGSSVQFVENAPTKKSYVARILIASSSDDDGPNGSSLPQSPAKNTTTSKLRNRLNTPKKLDVNTNSNLLELFHPTMSPRKTVEYTSQDLSNIMLKTPDLRSAGFRNSTNEVSPKEALRSASIAPVSTFSIAIPEETETDIFDDSNVNRLIQKPNVKPGKAWRRSFMHYRRGTQNEKHSIGKFTKNICDESKRFSCTIVLSDTTSQSRRKSLLHTYASSDHLNDEGPIGRSLIPKRQSTHFTAREIVLKYCSQSQPLLFSKLYPNSLLTNCTKIGEGVYGEVYLYTRPNRSTVIKIIPIEGSKIINGEKQKKFDEILSEVAIVSELSSLRKRSANQTDGFCEVQKIRCVQGEYPDILVKLWHEYDAKKHSENDCPDGFEKDQLYIVLELANGGQDLEAFQFNNALQAGSMFTQVAYSLAVAEKQLQFEHRDLHWGNVLLHRVNTTKTVDFRLQGNTKVCKSLGVQATVIDFTLSRMTHDGVTIFTDLGQDPDLFLSEGDYQFDIYRLMKERNNNDWKTFTPYSNLLWLHYILRKAIKGLRYKNVKSKVHKTGLEALKEYESKILNFNSVCEFVTECLQ